MAVLQSHIRDQITWIALMDLLCLVAGSALGAGMRFGHEELAAYVFSHLDGWFILFSSVLVGNYLAGNYKIQYTFSRFNLVVMWLFSIVFSLLILSITSYAWFTTLLGRGVLVLSLTGYSVLSLGLKLFVYRRLFQSDAFTCRVAVLGCGAMALRMRALLENPWVMLAHKVVAFVRVDEVDQGGGDRSRRFMDDVALFDCPGEKLSDLMRSLDVRLLVMATDERGGGTLYPQLRRIRFEGIEVLSALGVAELYSGGTPLDLINEDSLMDMSLESGQPTVRHVKRLTDIVVSTLACLLLIPVGILIAGLMKLTAPLSPVFYSQTRLGRFGKPFRIYKFRTMRVDAEVRTGPVWSVMGDDRVTRLGRVLRRFRLDETPQFINIILGDMSLVGPRPERQELVADLEEKVPYYRERENVLPGLTGWAQIRYPYGSSIDDAAKKLEFDLYYIKHLSFVLDLQILLSTLQVIIFSAKR